MPPDQKPHLIDFNSPPTVKPLITVLLCFYLSYWVSGCAVAMKQPIAISQARLAGTGNEISERAAIYARVKRLFIAEDFKALEQLAQTYRTTKGKTRSGRMKLSVFYEGIRKLAASSYHPHDFRNSIELKAGRWSVQFSNSPTPEIANAIITLAQAHKYRDSGLSPEDSPGVWERYYNLLRLARQSLLERPGVAEQDPTWYQVMFDIAAEEDWGSRQYYLLVSRALAQAPDYPEIFLSAARYYLSPGNEDKVMLERLARLVTDRTKDKEGMAMYARIYSFASHHDHQNRLFRDPRMDWGKIKQGINDVLGAYPDQWNINNFARMACIAGDRDTTRELIEKIHDGPVPQVWQGKPTFSHCQVWAVGNLI